MTHKKLSDRQELLLGDPRDERESDAWDRLRNAAGDYTRWLSHFAHPMVASMRPQNYTQPGWEEYKALVDAALAYAATSHHDRTRFGRGYYAAIQDAAGAAEDSAYASGPALRRVGEHIRNGHRARGLFEPLEDAVYALLLHVLAVGDRVPALDAAIRKTYSVLRQIERDRMRPRFGKGRRRRS